MSKIKKRVALVAGLLLAIVVAAAWWAYGRLGGILEKAVEAHGPAITGTKVSLDGATVSIFSGAGALDDLVIGNPASFSDGEAFRLDAIEIAVDVRSLAGDVIKVRSIAIDGPKLLAEFDARGLSNLQAIREHARAAAGRPAPQSGAAAPPKKLIIEEFVLTNAEVRVLAPAFKVDETLKLGPVRLKGLGAEQGGAAAAEIVDQILRPVVDEAVQSARNKFMRAKRDELKDKAAEKLLDKVFD